MSRAANRRREIRSAAQGPVKLVIDSPLPCEITGTLLDFSSSGFRAAHNCHDLQRGDRVQFDHKDATGSAVVIWTRVVSGTIETGFLLSR